MSIICLRCGSEKEDPFQLCAECKSGPESEEEFVLSALLTGYLLDQEALTKAAKSASYLDPTKISKGAYDLISNWLRKDGILPNQ